MRVCECVYPMVQGNAKFEAGINGGQLSVRQQVGQEAADLSLRIRGREVKVGQPVHAV